MLGNSGNHAGAEAPGGVWAHRCAESDSEPQAEDLALIEHDLRAGFADILGGLSLIDTAQLDEAGRRQIARVQVAAEAASRLIARAAAAIAGRRRQEGGGVSVPGLIADIEARWGARAALAGGRLTLTRAEGVPERLALDEVALERVLSNLISNAIKYSAGRGIELSLRAEPEGCVTFRLSDEGPGFSDAALKLLFTRYGRPEDSAQPGTGLGLHISDAMTRALGGTLRVRNRSDRSGAIAELCVPLRSPVPEPADAEVPSLAGRRVLVADDSDTVRLVLAQMLRRLGAEVVAVPSGEKACAALAQERFDLALVDLEMTGGSGRQVLTAPEALGVAMVVVTGHAAPEMHRELRALGARAVLVKPVTETAVLGRLLCDVLAQGAPQALDGETLAGLLEMAGADVGRELLTRVRRDLSAALGSAQAAPADRAVQRAQSHILIGLAGTIGAPGLLAQAQRLNATAHEGSAAEMGAALAAVSAELGRVLASLPEEPQT